VLREQCDPSGGGKVAAATLWLPRRQRVLIGVDDTDTSEEGATWTLVHNIAKAVEDEKSVYLSHTIVQLFPVAYRTKNCVSLVAEFATTEPEQLVGRFGELLRKYTLSEKTGMAVYTGFSLSKEIMEYARNVKRGEVAPNLVQNLNDPHLRIIMNGRGITGAVAALPFFTRYEEALELCSGKS
jgi:methanogenesis imperfect marker protein 11